MLINGNLVGLAMVVFSALIVAFPGYLFKLPNPAVMIGIGVVLITVDLTLRAAKRPDAKWLMSPRTGGYLFFIPVWIFGIAVVIVNVINALILKK